MEEVVMRALLLTAGVVLIASVSAASPPSGIRPAARAEDRGCQLAQAGERVGQDPAPPGADALPGSDEAGERVGNDPDVPGGEVPTTPAVRAPLERIGNDPDVPTGGGSVR
jgi:hypothetical protein